MKKNIWNFFNSIKKGYNKINASSEVRTDKVVARTNKDMVSRLNDIVGKPLFRGR